MEKKTNLKKQKCKCDKVNNCHSMNQAPNCRMWPNKYTGKKEEEVMLSIINHLCIPSMF